MEPTKTFRSELRRFVAVGEKLLGICRACHGEGRVLDTPDGQTRQYWVRCHHCDGSGDEPEDDD